MKLRNKNNTIKRIIVRNLHKNSWKHGFALVRDIVFNLDIELSSYDIRQFIKELRLAGTPIIASSSKGYKLAKTEQELQEYKNYRIKEMKEEIRALNAMKVGK